MFPNYRNKKVTVIGLARSGVAAACLLKDLGAYVFVTDNSSDYTIGLAAEDLRKKGIKVETGAHSREFILDKDLIVASPGVDQRCQALVFARGLNIPVISEIELAWSVCPATVIAITGTNGKTTVTTLVAKVLEAKGLRAFALGNIGAPFSGRVREMNCADFVSLEVSSFQLEGISKFKPRVSAVLNFSPNHLDKEHRGYNNIEEYLDVKKRIFMNQDANDCLVLNYDDPLVRELSKEARAKVIFFNQKKQLAYNEMRLNPNHLAVMAVVSVFGISEDVCLEVFRNFKGIEHRLERVREINGVVFINDSKATNVDSTKWALNGISMPVILIAGGRDKNIDYLEITDLIKTRVKHLILIGEAKEKIRQAYEGLVPMQDASSLEEAVAMSFRQALSGDCVLLSPMCSSFDMFENYEQRGSVFKEIVNRLEV